MKHILFFLTLLFSGFLAKAQCFEIESILVDACGAVEGENEMVRFKVGAAPLNTANLSVVWPNNGWQNVCQNATTANKVATLNASIQNCGFLKEPVGGILPANSRVLLITSTNFNTTANSFATLSDTLIVIFQCAGNTAGHFANTGTGTRSMSMTFSGTGGCSDNVTYDRSLLNQYAGSYDGGTVEFTPAGVASYVNYGCQAPFLPLIVDAGPAQSVCFNATAAFTATASGAYASVNWSGGSGSFAPSTALSTTYTPGAGETGTVKLYCSISKSCGTQTLTVKDSVNLTILQVPTLTISPSVLNICPGQNATLVATSNAAGSYTWSTGANTNTISVNSAGVRTVSVTNQCGMASASATVTVGGTPTISIVASQSVVCPGQPSALSINGATGSYTWSTGSNAALISATVAGVYSATVNTGCGIASASYTLGASQPATVTIVASSTLICAGQSVTLTAVSNVNTFTWTASGANTSTTTSNTPGLNTVSVSNQCGIQSASINLVVGQVPSLTVTPTATLICPNDQTTLTATGGTAPYTWSHTTATGPVVSAGPGSYTVSSSNACGTGSTTVSVAGYTLSAGIIANPTSGIKPLTVSFGNSSVNATTYAWNFGNGNNSTLQNPGPQTYSSAGVYMVILTASNGNCSDQDTVYITVLESEPFIIVPNVFTPNGDLANDVFFIKGGYIKDISCTIYNRWGLKLFSWDGLQEGWDGKIGGSEASEGNYFYMVEGKDIYDKTVHKEGTFLLIR